MPAPCRAMCGAGGVVKMMDNRRAEIDRNLEFFLKELPSLLPAHRGKFAIMRHQTIVDFYDTPGDAIKAAKALYPDEIYSVQQVTDSARSTGTARSAFRSDVVRPIAARHVAGFWGPKAFSGQLTRVRESDYSGN